LVTEVQALLESDDLTHIDPTALESLKLYYLKSKYLIRLRETLDRVKL